MQLMLKYINFAPNNVQHILPNINRSLYFEYKYSKISIFWDSILKNNFKTTVIIIIIIIIIIIPFNRFILSVVRSMG